MASQMNSVEMPTAVCRITHISPCPRGKTFPPNFCRKHHHRKKRLKSSKSLHRSKICLWERTAWNQITTVYCDKGDKTMNYFFTLLSDSHYICSHSFDQLTQLNLKLTPSQVLALGNHSSILYPLQDTTATWSYCFYALVHPVHI